MAEDLLKKLPGVEVDPDGSIRVNGKRVTRVLVDGKEYFGDNIRIATKNFPVELIDKVQVTDTRTREQEFSGLPGSGEEKTLNLTLRKDAPKVFGKLSAGAGDNGRYDAIGMLNYFDGELQASALGFGNNVNKIGYGTEGGQAQAVSVVNEGTGITDTQSGGINFSDTWKNNIKVNGSYFYNQASTGRATRQERRQNVLPDSSFLYISHGDLEDDNHNHRFNFSLEMEPDTMTRILIRPSFSSRNFQNSHLSLTGTTTDTGRLPGRWGKYPGRLERLYRQALPQARKEPFAESQHQL